MEIERNITINAPATHVWNIVGTRFHEVGSWVSMIHTSDALRSQSGTTSISDRVCNTTQGIIKEKVTHFDNDQRTVSYIAYEGLPGFVIEGGNTWTVKSIGQNRTEVRMRMKFDLKPIANLLMGWMLKRQMGRVADDVFRDLKVYAETGQVSENKRNALAQYARKGAPKRAAA